MESLVLKPAKEADWQTVAKLESSSASKVFAAMTDEKEIKNYLKKSKVYFILRNDEPIGTVSYEPKEDGSLYFDGLTIAPPPKKRLRNGGYEKVTKPAKARQKKIFSRASGKHASAIDLSQTRVYY